MSKRTVFTTVTPLPPGISRETVMDTLRNHVEMIDLNPLVEERHPIKPPPNASPEEYHCQWYSLTDKVSYLPGGMMSGKVTYTACFHDLAVGLQTHVYAPLGLNIKGKWTLGGSLPGEPIAPVELGVGVPLTGLWLREDVDMKCNFMMTTFVKGTLKKSHSTLVSRLLMKAQISEATQENQRIDAASQRGGNHSPVSEYSQQSYSDRSRVESWAASTYQASHTPPSQHSEQSDLKNEDDTLRPRPLSIRSTSTTSAGPGVGSQPGRPAYQDGGNAGKVSWQALNQSRSPPNQHAQPAGVPSPYRSLLDSSGRQGDVQRHDSWHSPPSQQQSSSQPGSYQQFPGQDQSNSQYQNQQQGQCQQQHPGSYHQQTGHSQSPPPVELPQSDHQEKRQVYEMA